MARSFDDIADLYDETRELPSRVLEKFYEIIDREIKLHRNIAVLDDGVGTGRTVGPLLDRGVELVGVDISSTMLKKTLEKLKKKNQQNQVLLIMADVTRLPLRASSFDLVISVQVLHLVKNWKRGIQEAKCVLRPQGAFVVGDAGSPFNVSEVGRKYDEISRKFDARKRLLNLLKPLVTGILANIKSNTIRKILENAFAHFGMQTAFYYDLLDEYLKENWEYVRERNISWSETIKVADILSVLDRRLLSKQWKIQIQIHERIMFQLKKWVNKKMGSAQSSERIKRNFKIYSAKFR